MRIIGGQARGHRLSAVRGRDITRPTADRVKEAIFNVLGGRVIDAKCLDLFAGTGALGLEALSRGAAFVHWVEKNREACQVIRKNIDATGLTQGIIIQQDVPVACRRFSEQSKHFDLIFSDPPYGKDLLPAVIHFASLGLLAPKGTLVLESGRDEELPPCCGNIVKRRSDRYGDTVVHYYQWKDESD